MKKYQGGGSKSKDARGFGKGIEDGIEGSSGYEIDERERKGLQKRKLSQLTYLSGEGSNLKRQISLECICLSFLD